MPRGIAAILGKLVSRTGWAKNKTECQEVGALQMELENRAKISWTHAEELFHTEMRHSATEKECPQLFKARVSQLSVFWSEIILIGRTSAPVELGVACW